VFSVLAVTGAGSVVELSFAQTASHPYCYSFIVTSLRTGAGAAMLAGMFDDQALIQIVDAAMAEAVRKSGAWVVCQPGCTPCCHGPFPISQHDALRLISGLRALEHRDSQRAIRVRDRARVVVKRFRELSDDEPCPVLDPETGTCDLYSARPMTCRVFGPAVRGGDGQIGVCELCYSGASDEEIADCAIDLDLDSLEGGASGETSVADCLAGDNRSG
jgi:Fe-S-cluster containining protein